MEIKENQLNQFLIQIPSISLDNPIPTNLIVENFLLKCKSFSDYGKLFQDIIFYFEEFLNAINTSDDLQTWLLNDKTAQCFIDGVGPSCLLLSPSPLSPRQVSQLIKLPDLLANACCGNLPQGLDVDSLMSNILTNLLLCQVIAAHVELGQGTNEILSLALGSAVLNYSPFPGKCLDLYFQNLLQVVKENDAMAKFLPRILGKMKQSNQISFFRCTFQHTKCGEDSFRLLQYVPADQLRAVLTKILTSSSMFNKLTTYSNMICFLAIFFQPVELVRNVFLPVLTLWSDPVIARAHIRQEVIHLTKLIFLIMIHLDRKTLVDYNLQIAQELTRGLPNHFSSTDPRTVVLAKFICQFLTVTMRESELQTCEQDEPINDLLNPEDPICQEVLSTFHTCSKTKQFWLQIDNKLNHGTTAVLSDNQTGKVLSPTRLKQLHVLDVNDEDDDDDSDLEAIDSCDVPVAKGSITYLRQFIEQLPELKTFDQMQIAFRTLPKVIQYQLALEHPSVGKDLVDAVFGWENEFESPELDDLKKTNLCQILQSKMDGNVEHLCAYFNRDSVQAYKKNLVLDVLINVANKISLKDLDTLTRVTFRELLFDATAIERQDTINKIPMVLFFQKVLCLLPQEMVLEDLVVSYLSALSRLTNVDSGLVQTVQYSVHRLVQRLDGVTLTPRVRHLLVDTRNIVWAQ